MAPALTGLPEAVRVLRVLPVLPAGSATADGALVDSHGTLALADAPTATSLVLIRPDGYVGVISDAGEPASITAYLDALLPVGGQFRLSERQATSGSSFNAQSVSMSPPARR